MQWKRDYLDLADHIERVTAGVEPSGRVAALIRQYGAVTRALLYSQVNGGLDECYMEFPDAPEIKGCKHGETCYCDLLKQRDDFIVAKGFWAEFMAWLTEIGDAPISPSPD